MFNSKYNKLLTALLIIAIIVIVGILIWVGFSWYNTMNSDAEAGADQFDGYINNTIKRPTNITNSEENNSEELIEPDIDVNNTAVANTAGNAGTTTSKPKYKGFYMVGKIEIPKINLKCPVLEDASPAAIDVAVAVLSGPGINKVGNTLIIGHNYRNGTFFSNNKKLELGDKIYLTDLSGKKVTYKITKKYNTSAEDADYMLRDTKGKREITLSTCTDDSKQRLILWAVET